jgi:hypothetical protein
VIVAVIAVDVVQVPCHEIIDVVAMRHGFVPAARAMAMLPAMMPAVVSGRAACGILCADLHLVLLHAACPVMVQVPIVQVIDVAVVADAGVPAPWPVLVVVLRMMSVAHTETSVRMRRHEPLGPPLAGRRAGGVASAPTRPLSLSSAIVGAGDYFFAERQEDDGA